MKTVLITGANAGIGFATAKVLAARPEWHVVLACRNESKANAAIAAIRNAHPKARLSFALLDLFSLASVRRLPEVLAWMRVPTLSGLILNAGGFNSKAKSLEFLAHFVLANLLVRQM